MSDNQQKPAKTIFASTKLRLTAPCPTAKGKWSNLSFDIWNSNPRIVVTTNDPALANPENQYGRITAALDAITMMAFIEILKTVAKSEGPTKTKIENYGTKRGGDPKIPEHLTDLWVGKDDNGIVFISVLNKAEGWPTIKFTFGPSDGRYHKIFKGDGSEYTKSDVSSVYALAYSELVSGLYTKMFAHDYVHPVSNFGKKSYQPQQQTRSAPVDSGSAGGDDIPW